MEEEEEEQGWLGGEPAQGAEGWPGPGVRLGLEKEEVRPGGEEEEEKEWEVRGEHDVEEGPLQGKWEEEDGEEEEEGSNGAEQQGWALIHAGGDHAD